MDGDHEHDLDYSSNSSGKSHDLAIKVEQKLTAQFHMPPEFYKQFKHPAHNVPCIICDCKPFKSVGTIYMHIVKTHTKPIAPWGLDAIIRWLHGGKETPW